MKKEQKKEKKKDNNKNLCKKTKWKSRRRGREHFDFNKAYNFQMIQK